MTKILFWTNAYAPMIGGAEIWAQRYLGELKARGHAISVIAVTDADGATALDTIDGIEVLWIPLRKPLDARDPALFKAALARADDAIAGFAPDIVQISNFGVAALMLAGLLRSRLRRQPVLLTAHNIRPDEAAAPGSPLDGIARAADRTATFDPSVAGWLQDRWPNMPVTVIPHAVPRPEAAVRPPDADAPFLFCGRLSPEKGAVPLIEAFGRVVCEAPGARLVIAGDGTERARVAAAIEAHGIVHAVTMLGAVAPAEVAALIERSLAVVIPSFIEGFGLIAAEAAWCGRAAIASDVGGLPSTVVHGETGLLCPPGDTMALADAMLALHRSPDRAAVLGLAARAAAEARPSWPDHVDAFERLFDRLLGR
jgi:glycosyltransferase involved in cell wall biosynthesis